MRVLITEDGLFVRETYLGCFNLLDGYEKILNIVRMREPTDSELIGCCIKKWEMVSAGQLADLGALNCALCIKYNNRGNCTGCPVAAHTGHFGCGGTPYHAFYDRCRSRGFVNHVIPESETELRELARKEAEFLKTL